MHVALTNMARRVGVLTAILFAVSCSAVFAQSPSAAFTVSVSSGCAPLSVNFSNTSAGATAYQWNFGNGNFSSLANPQNVYIQPGTYQVSMIASAGGQSDTATTQITVTAGPQLNISVNSFQGCSDVSTFQFTCLSTDVANLSWDFGDGTSSTELNPEKVYANPGFFTVNLLATNTAGCQSFASLSQTVQVIEPPVAGFSVNNTETCNELEEFNFTSSSINGNVFAWDFGDGSISNEEHPDHVFNGSGVFTVSLSVSNAFGCTDTYSVNDLVTVHPDNTPVISASVYSGCLPLASSLTSNVSGALSYSWTSSDGQSASTPNFQVTYFPAGNYEINLHVVMPDGCSFSSASPTIIQVNPKPVASFAATNIIGCAPLQVNLNNTSQGATNYSWTFSDGGYSFDEEPLHSFQDAGVYSITLKAFNQFGCWRTFTIDSIVVTAPTIEATLDNASGCPPLSIELTNTTINAVSYLWDFGDGTFSTDSIPQHSYTELGNYTLSLIAFGSGGCSDTLVFPSGVSVTAQQANYPVPPPLAGCAPFTTSFGLNDPYIISYLWDFGDGTTSTSSNPVHTYQQPGTYTVSLQINDGSVCGLSYPNYQQITVEGIIPEFEVVIDPCPPYQVHFTDTLSDAVSWLWDFGDGNTSTLQNPTHVYATTNNYHTGLTIVTAAGCERTFVGFNAVTFGNIQPSFVSSYNPSDPFPSQVSFQASSIPGASSWSWDFGDGNTGTGQSVSHVYQNAGEYQVVLTVASANCILTVSGEAFSIPSEPVGSGTGGSEPPVTTVPAQPFVSCAPASASFYPQSSAHQIIEWDFGDGTTSSLSNPLKVYTQPGIYNVSYTANTPQGIQTITYPMSVMIGGFAPEMLVTTDSDCDYFYMETNLNDAALFDQVQWSFGGSTPQSGVQVSWQVPLTNSSINITAMARDTLGCYSVANQNVLMDKPMPFVSYPTTVCRDAIHFEQLAGTGGLSFFWEFGDGETSNEDSPVHQYDSTGAYTVHLTITTEEGCVERHSLSPQIIFATPPMNYVVEGPWNGCQPHELQITYPGALAFVNFSFGDNFLSNTDTVQLSFPDTGVYEGLQMIATTTWISGCRDTLYFDPIHVYGAFADFSFTQDANCIPVQAQFTDQSNDAQAWYWDFGNGISSTLENPLIGFTAAPGDSVTLAMETIYGCRDTITKAGLEIFTLEQELQFQGACNPLEVQFNVTASETCDFEWHLGNGIFETQQSFSYTYTEDGAFLPFVIGISTTGCRDTAFAAAPVNVTSIEADFSSATSAACAPSIIQFTDLSQGAVEWDWGFGDFSGSSLQNPLKLYNTPGEYTVSLTVTSAYGCQDTKTVNDFISVLGPGTSFSISPVGGSCVGSPISFTDLSVDAIEWEWNFGEGSSTNEQNPSFIYTSPGNYIITLFARDSLGCSAFYSIPVAYTIYDVPDAEFTLAVDSGCTPFSPLLENTSSGATGYQWDFGDGESSNLENPTHTYDLAGDYFIQLIARNQHNCYDTARVDPVRSLLVPKAFLSIDEVSGCIPLDVQIESLCYDLDHPSYLLYFADTVLHTNPDSIYTFYDPGFYSVKLIVQNINACADTIFYPHAIQVFDIYPPSVSEIIRVSVENSESVRVEWTQNYDPQFAHYAIYRRINQSGAFELIHTIEDSHTLVFSDTSVNVLDSVYCYKVNVVDVCGRSMLIDSLTEHCTVNVETITNPDNSIDVTWTPYIGRQAGHYVILRREESTGITEDIAVIPGDSLHFKDQTVVCPVKYVYTIKAIELDGLMHLESDSDEDIADPIENPFLNQFVNVGRSTVINNSFILTEWSAPDTLNESTVGYAIFRASEGESFDWVANIPAAQTFYIDSLVDVNREKYYYQVYALNHCGMESGAGVLGDNIVLTVEQKTDLFNKLLWTPYTSWGENGVGFYNVEMQLPDGSWVVIKSLPGQVTEFLHEGF